MPCTLFNRRSKGARMGKFAKFYLLRCVRTLRLRQDREGFSVKRLVFDSLILRTGIEKATSVYFIVLNIYPEMKFISTYLTKFKPSCTEILS